MSTARWTIIVGIDLAPWNVLEALQHRAGAPPPLIVIFPERFLHPSKVRTSIMPALLRLGTESPVVVTHSQSVLTGFGDAVATGSIACSDVVIVQLTLHVSDLNVERWEETRHTFDAKGNLSAGWPVGYLEP